MIHLLVHWLIIKYLYTIQLQVNGKIRINQTLVLACKSRATVSVTEYSVGSGSSVDTSFNTAKTYALLEVTATTNCWITFYTDSTSRYNDSTRTSGTDPAGGSGVIAEVFTTGSAGQTETITMTPSVFGFNMDSTPSIHVI